MTDPVPPVPPVAPPDDELIVGFVAAVGIDLEQLTAELRAVLSEFGYRSHDLHLTDVFADFEWPMPLVEKPFDERIWSYMDAGDTLCDSWKRNDAMAMLAVSQISLTRTDLTGNVEVPPERTAYILRSLKRSKEVEFLRAVYGRRFFLIGVSTDEAARIEFLEDRIRQSRIPPYDRIPVHSAQELAARDEEDDRVEYGQNVRDT